MKIEYEKAQSLAREAIRCVMAGIQDDSARPRAMESMRDHAEHVTPLLVESMCTELETATKRVADLEHDLANARTALNNLPVLERITQDETAEKIARWLDDSAARFRAENIDAGANHYVMAAEFIRKGAWR